MFLVSYQSPSNASSGKLIVMASSVSEAACEFLRRSPDCIVVGYPVAI